ncbi:amidohydrolase family protein [Cryptosporangium arvum]|uniref:amidohydrolase family protein n=1 Tax=Cryptosporangium arvum TaxID=80871 RepID=UPI0004BBFE54|nr:amidohydrolase family protein [Cryptosporangium arvum]
MGLLIDHHCHGVVTRELDRAGFEALISEGGAPPPGDTNFDTPVGLAIRRHCAPRLDLPEHASPEDYLARRAELGTEEVTRRLLATTGTARYLVDTGFNAEGLTTPEQLAGITGARAHHVVRLEKVAEDLASDGVDPAEFAGAFRDRLHRAVADVGAVGVKSVAAYRTGFRLDPAPPGAAEVTAAVARWGGTTRLADPVLQRFTLEAAVELGLPIQFHVGFGDRDIRMTDVDPTLLSDWIGRHRVPVMLLHCWPYQRQASFLAAVFPNVHVDVGLALHYVGPRRGVAVLAELAEVAPFTRAVLLGRVRRSGAVPAGSARLRHGTDRAAGGPGRQRRMGPGRRRAHRRPDRARQRRTRLPAINRADGRHQKIAVPHGCPIGDSHQRVRILSRQLRLEPGRRRGPQLRRADRRGRSGLPPDP